MTGPELSNNIGNKLQENSGRQIRRKIKGDNWERKWARNWETKLERRKERKWERFTN